MGYDTAGLIKFVQDPGKNPEDLLHGFYFDNSIDTTTRRFRTFPSRVTRRSTCTVTWNWKARRG